MGAVIGAQFQMDYPHHVLHRLPRGLKVVGDGSVVVAVGHQFEDVQLFTGQDRVLTGVTRGAKRVRRLAGRGLGFRDFCCLHVPAPQWWNQTKWGCIIVLLRGARFSDDKAAFTYESNHHAGHFWAGLLYVATVTLVTDRLPLRGGISSVNYFSFAEVTREPVARQRADH